MGIVLSLILIAAGAILTWGVTDSSDAVNLDAVGVVLMVVGLVGALLDLMLWSSWGPGYLRRRRTVHAAPAGAPYAPAQTVTPPSAPGRRTVVEEEIEEPGRPLPPP